MVDSQTEEDEVPAVDPRATLCGSYVTTICGEDVVGSVGSKSSHHSLDLSGDIIRMRRDKVVQDTGDNPLPFNYTIGADGAAR